MAGVTPGSQRSAEAAVALLRVDLQLVARLFQQLRALPRPKEGRSTLDAYFAESKRGLRVLENAVKFSDDGSAESAELDTSHARERKLAAEYGFKVCDRG
jgi:predicted GNAT family N-acyltransferase